MRSEDVRRVLGRKRSIEILEYLAAGGIQNFSNIAEKVDSSTETISSTLDLLHEYGLIDRNEYTKKDVRYRITEDGERLLKKVQTIIDILSKSQ